MWETAKMLDRKNKHLEEYEGIFTLGRRTFPPRQVEIPPHCYLFT